ncbi:proactivator polypeptide-like 1 [Lolium rigidum]|uniref:proactivator polypeptide-like 1 n=1 Tax=Lolium rigidum TaxID=89674 RepID=UPI001F5CF981|nr:proactivator polypeptide-like 1 [Lolium rigidum]
MGLGPRVPFCLILLLLVSLGAAQARSTVLLDIEKEARNYGQISKEELASSKIPVHVERGSPLCTACQNFTTDALNYLSQKESQDKMMEVLHDACAQTFTLEKKCAELVDYYASLLFAKIAEIKPDEFCQQYGLCNSLLSGVRGESTCAFCHRFVDEIEEKLKDPDAEFEILQLLLKECNKLQGHEQQCKRLVLQYLPLILVNGEKFLEKNDICTIVQACDASKNTMVGSFSEGALLSDA